MTLKLINLSRKWILVIYRLQGNWWSAGYARMRMMIPIWRHHVLVVAA
jgi:hypothetical protein